MTVDYRTRPQRWADVVTEFSGSWLFIGLFVALCMFWVVANVVLPHTWDPYPFLFLNWILAMISTFQNPLILLSQNRQNENDRARTSEILERLADLQTAINEMKKDRLL